LIMTIQIYLESLKSNNDNVTCQREAQRNTGLVCCDWFGDDLQVNPGDYATFLDFGTRGKCCKR
jgi:hypothetical protein